MAAETVQQWVTIQNGLDKLSLQTVAVPTPGKDEVLVKIQTVSLNYRDTEVCMGLYGHHQTITSGGPEPLVPCSDMCGTIIAVGANCAKTWEVGTRVISVFNHMHLTGHMEQEYMEKGGFGLPLPGVLQTYRVFPSMALMPAPAYLSDAEAACLPIAAVTAWMAINGMRPIGHPVGSDPSAKEKPIVLVQGTGGVSISGLQIAHAFGATCVVTSSSDAKLAKAKELGADALINYKTTPRWADAVMEVTNGHGADIILEQGGAGTLRQSFDAVAFGGLINCIGYLGGKQDKTDADSNADRTGVTVLALRRNLTIRGIINGPRDRFAEMLAFYTEKEIHPVVDRTFAFSESPEALQYLFSGRHFGKVVIKVG